MTPPTFVVNHRRTGVAALNVVTAALDVDRRTRDTEIVELFAALRRGEDPRAIRGIAFHDGERFISHGHGERRELDAFPAFNARHAK